MLEYKMSSFLGQSPICTDIDECALEIHDCQQGTVCHNLPGFYRCIEEFRTVSKNQTQTKPTQDIFLGKRRISGRKG